MQVRFTKRVAIIFCAVASCSAQGALIFNFTANAGSESSYNQILPAFEVAAARWSGFVTDDIQVNVALGYIDLGALTLSQTAIQQAPFQYSDFKQYYLNDVQSADDQSVFDHLQKPEGDTFNLLINRAKANPGDVSSDTPYLDQDKDANNQSVRMTLANAKALGFDVDTGVNPTDATITLNNAIAWDNNPLDGVDGGKYDLVGVAMREIGRALGFVSGVDVLDNNSPPVNGPFDDYQFTYVTPLDLLRYSADSVAYGDGVFDWTADNRAKYLSLDGGATALAEVSTGVHFGDGNSAGNWKAGQNTGVMNPTPTQGQKLDISMADLRAIDAIGYNVVPEPSAVMLILAAGVLRTFRRRRTP